MALWALHDCKASLSNSIPAGTSVRRPHSPGFPCILVKKGYWVEVLDLSRSLHHRWGGTTTRRAVESVEATFGA